MKKVLSLLLAFVFLQVQTWALSGGPQYGGNQAALTGTYAGVLTGVRTTVPTSGTGSITGATTDTANSLGIFVIGVPEVDVAQGSIALFFQGIFFQGGILGIADPNEGELSGVAQMIHISSITNNNDFFFGDSTTITYDARCDGTIETEIESSGAGRGTTLQGTGTFTVATLIADPQTVIDPETGLPITILVPTFPPAGTLNFRVDGFKQSATIIVPDGDSTAGLLNGTGGDGGNNQ